MKILLVTAWYAPFIHPRAHRWTAVAEHWAGEGHEVHVLTARLREAGQNENLHGVQIHRVGFDSLKEWVYFWLGSRGARGRVGVKPSKPSLSIKLVSWVYKTVWKNLFFPDDACVWYFPARRKLRELLDNEHFDAVISVSLPFTGHLLGLLTFRKFHTFRKFQTFGKLKPIWLADIGDPFSFQAKPPNNSFLYGNISRRLERKILETADAVTVTTEATLRKYREQFGEKSISNMTVIPPILVAPTFTPQNSLTIESQIPQNSIPDLPIIKIGYFGALYTPTRTPDAFLDLLSQTFVLRPDLYQRLEIHFYGEIFTEFFKKLNAEPSIRLHGLCSREEARLAMQAMDILLNIGNVTDFQLPSKAVDYMAASKPVMNLSYVKNDPFVEFFRDNPMIFNLKVENGKVENDAIIGWLEWIESEKTTLSNSDITKQVAPFLAERIASQYLGLLTERLFSKNF